ncbi:hypothetical protein, partial [uncultured Fibrobacter sp.]|uniref:hypothetical protein n=1 Tax=uncultured Fibrobacter sp. TaxID=261512 RepID=UPI0025E40E74
FSTKEPRFYRLKISDRLNNPSTGDPDPLFYEDLGEGFRTWLTSTYTEHGRMKIFSPDYEDRVDSFLVKKQKVITLFAV